MWTLGIEISTLCPFSYFQNLFRREYLAMIDHVPTDATSILIQQVNSGHQICIEVSDGFSHLTVFDHMDPMGLKVFNIFFWWWFGSFSSFRVVKGKFEETSGTWYATIMAVWLYKKTKTGTLSVHKDKGRLHDCTQRQRRVEQIDCTQRQRQRPWLGNIQRQWQVKLFSGLTVHKVWKPTALSFPPNSLRLNMHRIRVGPKSGVDQKISFSIFLEPSIISITSQSEVKAYIFIRFTEVEKI